MNLIANKKTDNWIKKKYKTLCKKIKTNWKKPFLALILLILSPLIFIARKSFNLGYRIKHNQDYENYKERFDNDFGNAEKNQWDSKWGITLLLMVVYFFILFSLGAFLKDFLNQIGRAFGSMLDDPTNNLDKFTNELINFSNFHWTNYFNPRYIFNSWLGIFSIKTSDFSLIGRVIVIVYIIFGMLGCYRVLVRNKLVIGKQNINKQQLGNDRFSRIDELVKEYKLVPASNLSFEGYGGVPITFLHWYEVTFFPVFLRSISFNQRWVAMKNHKKSHGWYLIDDTNVATNAIGMTRAGKGEKFVIPMIDLLSRSQKQSSLILHDMKRELADYTAERLKKRGYEIEFLNVMALEKSISYNPLKRVQDFLYRRNLDKAQKDITSLAFTIYNDPNNHENPYFVESPQSLLSSILLLSAYHIIKEKPKDRSELEKLTIYNAVDILNRLGGQTIQIQGSMKTTHGLNIAFENMRHEDLDKIDYLEESDKHFLAELRELALINYSASKFASENSQGNIFSTTANKLKIYLQKDVALMTSKNEIDLSRLGFPRLIELSTLNKEKYYGKFKVTILNDQGTILETLNIETDRTGFSQTPFNAKLADEGKIIIQGDQIENEEHQEVFSYKVRYKQRRGLPIINPSTKEKEIKMVVLEAEHNPSISLNIKYSNQPVALFLISPDHDKSYNQILSFIINQIYAEISELCYKTDGKTQTRVHFLLDEFGNLPAIDEIANKITVSLGKNILWSFFVQELAQYDLVYGKEISETIQNSCSNTIYLLSPSEKTAEKLSKKLGNRTVKGLSTSNDERLITAGEKNHNAMVNNNQQNLVKQELLTPTQLMKLVEGETVVIRVNKQFDNNQKRVKKNPIFNTLQHSLPSSYLFLKGSDSTFDFVNTQFQSEISDHTKLDLLQNKVNIEIFPDDNKEEINSSDLPNKKTKGYSATLKIFREELSKVIEWSNTRLGQKENIDSISSRNLLEIISSFSQLESVTTIFKSEEDFESIITNLNTLLAEEQDVENEQEVQ